MENNVKKKKYITKPMYSRTLLYSIVNVLSKFVMMNAEVIRMKNENERFVEMGKRIKARRVSLGMKQMELAERIDISNNHISSIERGIERPGLESFIRICDVLDVTPDYLLLGSMKANDIPKNITDNLKLCTDEEVRFVEAMTQYMIEQHKK